MGYSCLLLHSHLHLQHSSKTYLDLCLAVIISVNDSAWLRCRSANFCGCNSGRSYNAKESVGPQLVLQRASSQAPACPLESR